MLNNPLFLTLALVAILLAYGIYVIVYGSMPENRLKRSRDPSSGGSIDSPAAKVEDGEPPPSLEGKDAAAASLGRRGGLKSGKARATKMFPARRAEIAARLETKSASFRIRQSIPARPSIDR